MRVMIFPTKNGDLERVVIPGKGCLAAPVLIRGRDKDVVREEVRKVIEEVASLVGPGPRAT